MSRNWGNVIHVYTTFHAGVICQSQYVNYSVTLYMLFIFLKNQTTLPCLFKPTKKRRFWTIFFLLFRYLNKVVILSLTYIVLLQVGRVHLCCNNRLAIL